MLVQRDRHLSDFDIWHFLKQKIVYRSFQVIELSGAWVYFYPEYALNFMYNST